MDATAPLPWADYRPLRSDDDWAQVLELTPDCIEQVDDHRLFLQRLAEQHREVSRRGQTVWFGAFVDGRVRASLGLVSECRCRCGRA